MEWREETNQLTRDEEVRHDCCTQRKIQNSYRNSILTQWPKHRRLWNYGSEISSDFLSLYSRDSRLLGIVKRIIFFKISLWIDDTQT